MDIFLTKLAIDRFDCYDGESCLIRKDHGDLVYVEDIEDVLNAAIELIYQRGNNPTDCDFQVIWEYSEKLKAELLKFGLEIPAEVSK